MNEFKIGDVVYLKSDSEHKFTVCEVSKDTIKVIFLQPHYSNILLFRKYRQ